MAIKDIQRRQTEVGRIRIGETKDTGKKDKHGRPIMRPAKLEKFRFTSPSRALIGQVAEVYGGTPAEWYPQGGGAGQWEVYTQADSLPVVVPPNAVSQWWESWAGGACVRRCDGEREMLADTECQCSPDPAERVCNPTTRITLMLADLPGIGVWRLETHGYYAATELPAVAELLAAAGGYVSARLELEERSARRPKADGGGMETRRWMVPVLHVDAKPADLLALANAPAKPAIEAATVPALDAVPEEVRAAVADMLKQINTSPDLKVLRTVWTAIANSPTKLNPDEKAAVSAAFWARKKVLDADPAEPVATDGRHIDTEADDYIEPSDKGRPEQAEAEPDRQEVWTKILRLAGEKHGWNVPATSAKFREAMAKDATDANGYDMVLFLDALTEGAIS